MAIIIIFHIIKSNACYFYDFFIIIFDQEWNYFIAIGVNLLILLKLYIIFIVNFIEQIYIRLGLLVFIYMLSFYILFIILISLIFISILFNTLLFIKLSFSQTLIGILIGINNYNLLSLLFILSINNLSIIYLSFSINKNFLLYFYMLFHVIYSISLINLLITTYNIQIVSLYSNKYNEFYQCFNVSLNFFFNYFSFSLIFCTIIIGLGSIPIGLGFFFKVFINFILLSNTYVNLFLILILWLTLLYSFYFRLVLQLYYFSYKGNGKFVIKVPVNILFLLLIFISNYILIIDIYNLFDILF